jgi:hypothetical protein
LRDQRRGARAPGRQARGRRRRIVQAFQHETQRRLRIAGERDAVRIIAAQLTAVDVELDHGRALARDLPIERDHAAGAAADEEHDVGLGHRLVGACA